MYDFANSAFYTTVITLFLGPYLTALASNGADASGYVHPFGSPIYARSFWSYAVSVSVILQVLFLPMVGAVADYGRRKKEVLGATAYLGALATDGDVFSGRLRLSDGRIVVPDRQCRFRRGGGDL